jgi:hypothetical protein
LPPTRYELALWKPGKVNIDYHGENDAHFYSAPHRLVHEPVEARATAAVVEIFHRARRVASRVREYGRKRFITDPDHMPAAHRAHVEWTPSKLIAWGRSPSVKPACSDSNGAMSAASSLVDSDLALRALTATNRSPLPTWSPRSTPACRLP